MCHQNVIWNIILSVVSFCAKDKDKDVEGFLTYVLYELRMIQTYWSFRKQRICNKLNVINFYIHIFCEI